MCLDGGYKLELKMRAGKDISKPIASLCRMMDAGCRFHLGAGRNYMEMPNGEELPIKRQHNSRYFDAAVFGSRGACT